MIQSGGCFAQCLLALPEFFRVRLPKQPRSNRLMSLAPPSAIRLWALLRPLLPCALLLLRAKG